MLSNLRRGVLDGKTFLDPARFAARRPSATLFADGGEIEFIPQVALTTSDPEALVDLALAGAGIVQAGLHHALPHLRAGTLKVLMPGVHDAGKREIVLHYPHRQYLAPGVRVVVDALLAHFEAATDLQLTVDAVLAEQPGCVAAPGDAGPRGVASATASGAPLAALSDSRALMVWGALSLQLDGMLSVDSALAIKRATD